MSKLASLKVEIPTVEETVENRMRGGFLAIGNAGISTHGGPNTRCGNNEVCSDNYICYDNHDPQECSGNWQSSCVSNTVKPTPGPTPSVTPTAGATFSFPSFF